MKNRLCSLRIADSSCAGARRVLLEERVIIVKPYGAVWAGPAVPLWHMAGTSFSLYFTFMFKFWISARNGKSLRASLSPTPNFPSAYDTIIFSAELEDAVQMTAEAAAPTRVPLASDPVCETLCTRTYFYLDKLDL